MRKMQQIAMVLILIVLVSIIAPTHSFAASNTVYDVNNMLSPSNVTVEELEYALKGNLKPLAATYIQAEEETGVNAVFIASISALESGWGKSYMASSKNNLFGYGNKTFASKEESILHVANALRNNYLLSTGRYYNGTTVKAVEKCYCPTPVGHWSGLVFQIMRQMNSSIQEYRINHPQIIEKSSEELEIIKEEVKVQKTEYKAEIVKEEIELILNQEDYSIAEFNEFREKILNISRLLKDIVK